MEYNTHHFIVISALETEIRRFEYLSLNKQNCNYAGFDTIQSLFSASPLMCALFGSKCGATAHSIFDIYLIPVQIRSNE